MGKLSGAYVKLFMISAVVVLITLLCLPAALTAQLTGSGTISGDHSISDFSVLTVEEEASDRSLYWLHFGLGVGVPKLFSGVIGVSYQTDAHLLSIRYSEVSELFGDRISDFGFLYGRAAADRSTHASVSAGIAFVSGRSGGGFFSGSDADSFTTIGIPIEIQLYWNTSYVGIGFYGFGNLNPEQSFAGLSIALYLGRLR